jgi:D-glycero-D-manno-heptose 1,7-bisphosphate phosphatase
VGIHEVKLEMRRAVFLDRDGVINRVREHDGLPYPPASLGEFEIYPEVPEACRRLKQAGFLPGMLLRAARELGIELAQSWMVGDRWRDVDCGHAAGCRTVFIDRGYAEALKQPPDFRAKNLLEAAEIILAGAK